jgi:predicted phosphate transport protein (TIGR00153 family)
MRTFAKLFSRSPFVPLAAHIDRVADCVAKVPQVFDALRRGDQEAVEETARQISKLEHHADQVKDDIRNNLPRSLFLPVDRGNLLEILAIQDSLADAAEDIAVLLTFKPLRMPESIGDEFGVFLTRNLEAFEAVVHVMKQLDELLESGFGGHEAQTVKQLVSEVAVKEHEVDLIQRRILKALFAHEQEMSPGELILWMKIIPQVADLSNLSENLANRVRMTLEVK